jgi:hypothetical protein
MTKRLPKNLDWYVLFENLLGNNFLEIIIIEQKEILRIKPPLTIKFEVNIIQKIVTGLAQKVERGGILGCRPITNGLEKVLSVEQVIFIKNVSRAPYNSYLPRQADWNKAMVEIIFENQLLPLEFHSHPISKKNSDSKLFEYFGQMGASRGDRSLSNLIVQIGNYKVAIPQAIFIKDIQTSAGFFVGIYGGLVAPRNFEPEIIKIGGEKLIKFGETIMKWFQEQLADSKKKEIAKALGIISIIAGLAVPGVAISLLGFLLVTGYLSIWRIFPLAESVMGKEMPYFGMANVLRTLRIRVPSFNIANSSLKDLITIKSKEKKLMWESLIGGVNK